MAQPEIFYRKTGDGPAIVLLHGFPDNGEIWSDIAGQLAEHYTVLVPDLPGSGRSPLKGPTSLNEMAIGIEEIMSFEEIEKAVLIGHSMGGYTAAAFARLFPARIAGLSFVHSFAATDDEQKTKLRKKTISLLKNSGKKVFVGQMTSNLFAPSFLVKHPEQVRSKEELGMRMETEAMINFYEGMIGRDDNREVIQNVKCPVQWVIGRQDNVTNYKNIMKECHLSTVNFVTLYGNCGHMSMVEQPDMLVKDLKTFIEYCYFTGQP